MTLLQSIKDLWESDEFLAANIEGRVNCLRNIYEFYTKKDHNNKWKDNWKKSMPLVEKLVTLEFKVTYFLYSSTEYNGISDYNRAFYNVRPVYHNEEFVVCWLAIQSIWEKDSQFYCEIYEKPMNNEAIVTSISQFVDMVKSDYLDLDLLGKESSKFSYSFLRIDTHTGNNNCYPNINFTSTHLLSAICL